MHHVVSLLFERCQLIEYRRFPSFKAEIQTRSILQHAWAEIEHDLGYKSRQEVPKLIRRKFSRLAGLLELVDQEFITIRDELDKYEIAVPERIEKTPQLVTIDKASLTAFVYNNELVNKLDNVLASFVKSTILKDDETVASLVGVFQFFHIETIAEVESTLRDYADQVTKFAQEWLQGKEYESLAAGISLHYLGYILIARTDIDRISDYIKMRHFHTPEGETVLIQGITETYEKISGNTSQDG
jgi:putative GTP pyrophosphokinase